LATYGRFGLGRILSESIIIYKNEIDAFVDSKEIHDLIDL
jgi:hypothetical protein